MKIMVIPYGFPNEIQTRAGIFTFEQCRILAARGHEVTVLDASPYRYTHWNKVFFRPIKMQNREGMRIYLQHCCGLMTSRMPRLAMHTYYRRIKKLFQKAVEREGKPEVLYAHFTHVAGYTAAKLAEEYHIPLVVMEHGSLFLQKKLHPKIQKYLQETITRANSFICVSEHLKKAILKWSGLKKEIKVIPNMVSDIYSYAPRTKKEEFVFFAAGNLVGSKRFDLLIRAFCKVFKETDKVRLMIAGAGKKEEELRELIKANQRSGQISLLGSLNSEEMLQQYIACDVFVLPSQYETFGIVYREAMTVGRPIIGTKNGGIQENWDDQLGILIDVDDENQLVKALKDMYNNYGNYDLADISNHALSLYSKDVVSTQIEKILSNAIDEGWKS